MDVLVTGAGGAIGRVVAPGLEKSGHEVVGVDLSPAPEGWAGRWHQVDAGNPDAVAALLGSGRFDAVVHLAGIPDETDLPTALASHTLTTACLLDAMVASGVPRMVYASSNHAVGRTPRDEASGSLGVGVPPRPDTFYGVGKVAAEALLRLYSERYGTDVVACRIGSFLPRPQLRRHLATWLSHEDCVRMVLAALEAPSPGFAVLYGISANTRAWWDLEPGRRLGYHPRDDAERFATTIPPMPDDEADDALVGGPFPGAAYYRPAMGAGALGGGGRESNPPDRDARPLRF